MPHSTHHRARGMSLIELMVGMAIGLIGIVIITHLYLTNEQYKRSTTGSGTAQVNGTIALYSLEREARMSGYGFAHSGALGCTCAGAGCSPVKYFYNGTYSFPPAGGAGGALQAMYLVPVLITQGFAGSTDSLTVLYGSNQQRMLPGTVQENMANAGSNFKVDGTTGFSVNDLVVVAQGASCSMVQITAIQTAASQLEHTVNIRNPNAGGTLPSFGQGALLFDLGSAPVWRRFSIASNKLQVQDMLNLPAGTAAQAIVDDIVDLQAEYGKDDGGNGGTVDDGLVDSWNTTTPATMADWRRVLAIRVGIVARSGNYEKPAPGAACSSTTVTPTWSGSATAGGVSAFTLPEALPSCYKYRVFETVIPIRNMIWIPI